MPEQPRVRFNDGQTIPQLGFGVFQVPPEQTQATVEIALAAGYRSIDTAAMYRNERGVGAALRASGLPRADVFLTTKLDNTDHGYDEALRAFETSRAALGVDYVDLYLIHWPLPRTDRYVESWRAFEKLQRDGVVRSIGVSNFTVANLQRLFAETDVVPALNQIELHPYFAQRELRAFHTKHGIVTEAWSPIARGAELLQEPAVVGIAEKYGKTPAQVVLAWQLAIGNVAIPKSVTPARIRANLDVFDIELDPDDIAAIDDLDRGGRRGPDPATFNP